MTIVKSELPQNSILNVPLKRYDYIDSFKGSFNDPENKIIAIDIGKAFFSSAPIWIDKLFSLRNKIVSLVGLKTSGKTTNRQQQPDNFKCEPGEQLGFFKVYNKTDHEVILGEDDKHLNFRVSLFLSDAIAGQANRILTISTTVEFNNIFGKLYFLPVRPFHTLIVPSMLKGIVKQLEEQIASSHRLQASNKNT